MAPKAAYQAVPTMMTPVELQALRDRADLGSPAWQAHKQKCQQLAARLLVQYARFNNAVAALEQAHARKRARIEQRIAYHIKNISRAHENHTQDKRHVMRMWPMCRRCKRHHMSATETT